MFSTQHEFRKWLKKTNQPYIVINNKPSRVLLNNFEKYKKQQLFNKIKKSGFVMAKKPHNTYSRGDFATWLQAGDVDYVREKHSDLASTKVRENKYYFKMFLEYQNKYSKK